MPRYYSYDKSGKLISVEYAASPEKNEYYAYDKQGNILEKRIGNSIYKYTYDTANQLMEMESPEGKREYFYDRAGRLIIEKFNGEIDVEYKYGYLDKVIEVNRNGKTTKFAYDGFGMLAQKTFHDGSTEVWVWDGLALIRRGSDIYVNEPHVSGGVPILSKTDEGVRYHEHDFWGTILWSTDTKGNLVKDYQDTTIFGEGSIQKDRSARFTDKPYDEDLQAYVFPYRNYDASTARWRSSDPAGYPDGINQHFYAAVPTISIDTYGLALVLVGQGGQSGGLFNLAANTWVRQNGGTDGNTVVQVSSGAEAIAAMNSYAAKNGGTIDSMQVFAHSGAGGIYFDQTSGTNSLYTNTTGIDTAANPGAKGISDINPNLFNGNADIKLWGCNTLNGDNSFGHQLGEHIGNNVTGATSGTQFSGNPDGPAGAGLPNPVPDNYTGDIYLVPDNGEWDTAIYSPMEK